MEKQVKKMFVLLLCSMTLSIASGCHKKSGQEQGEQVKSVMIDQVRRKDVAEILDYAANITAYMQVTIFSPIPDRIVYFPWNNGDEIKRGQRIALIRKEGLDKGLDQILAQLDALDVQIKNLKSEFDRSKELLKAGVITQSTYDKIQTSYLSTLARRRALEASRGQLEVRAGNAVINAPISGIIAEKRLERGDMAVPQIPLCVIMQVDRLKVRTNLVERDVPKVKEGMNVEVVLDAYPGRVFNAKVINIFPYLNPATRTNTIEAILENPKDKASGKRLIKPGMYGRARFVVSRRKNVLVVPEQALIIDEKLLGKQTRGHMLRKVFVVENDVVHQRTVTLGMQNNDYWEVTDGLKDGEHVVIRGQHRLKDGQKVKVIKPAEDISGGGAK
ncbi:MAG: efflux RND transporter periplasmic adaptor subunit [Deltaproteobacteria bacterium]|nr:efflux RND transporter periplasmic adaptor subunit [Deltaproteobacteria bacterium]